MKPGVEKGVPWLVAAACAAALAYWLLSPEPELSHRLAVAGEEAVAVAADAQAAPPAGVLTVGTGRPGSGGGAWPNFRGPNHDGISREQVRLARSWPSGGPKPLWSIKVGDGYAAAAIEGGRVYVLDYDLVNEADALRCLSLDDGEEIWRYSYPVKIKRNHGMSRTIPAVGGGCVVALGPMCHVTCLDAESGQLKWAIDLVRQYGTRVPEWYAGQCPLIDNGRAIIAPGAPEALIMAVQCQTGEVVWKTPNPMGWQMTHSSVIPMDFAGQRMYVYCGSGGVVGISPEDGSILWQTTAWRIDNATVPSPVPVGDGRIFLCGGYGAGAMMLQVSQSGGRFSAEPVFRLPPEVFASEQQTPVLYGGHIYGVLMKDAYELAMQLVCLDLQGRQVWTSGAANKFGAAPYLIADGVMFILNDSGVLSLVDISGDSFRLLARARVLPGRESWGPMALAGGRLIVRDLTTMVCLDVSEEAGR